MTKSRKRAESGEEDNFGFVSGKEPEAKEEEKVPETPAKESVVSSSEVRVRIKATGKVLKVGSNTADRLIGIGRAERVE